MKNPVLMCGALSLLVVLLCSSVRAQPIRVQGGNPSLTVTTGVAGGEPVPVVNTATSLRYQRQTVIAKITVSTQCTGQRFTLRVLATATTGGGAAPEVSLQNGASARDFVTNIPAGSSTNYRCTLRYTAAPTFSQGNSAELGTDSHTITYTLIAQ